MLAYSFADRWSLARHIIVQVIPPLAVTSISAIAAHTIRSGPQTTEVLAIGTMLLLLMIYIILYVVEDPTSAGQARFLVRVTNVAATAAGSALLTKTSMLLIVLAVTAALVGTFPIHRDALLAAQGVTLSVVCFVAVSTQQKRWATGYRSNDLKELSTIELPVSKIQRFLVRLGEFFQD